MTTADRHKMFELLLIGQFFRPGGLKHAVFCGRMIQQFDQVNQQILQRNRRGARTDPARRRQHWQVVDHIAHHFEGGGARANDNPGAQLADRHARVAQDIAGKLPGAEVRRLLVLWRL